MAWRLKAGLLASELALNHPFLSRGTVWPQKNSQLEMPALKASQDPVVWQKNRSLSKEEVVLGSQLTLDFSRHGSAQAHSS